jgi:hypothetical protein
VADFVSHPRGLHIAEAVIPQEWESAEWTAVVWTVYDHADYAMHVVKD